MTIDRTLDLSQGRGVDAQPTFDLQML